MASLNPSGGGTSLYTDPYSSSFILGNEKLSKLKSVEGLLLASNKQGLCVAGLPTGKVGMGLGFNVLL